MSFPVFDPTNAKNNDVISSEITTNTEWANSTVINAILVVKGYFSKTPIYKEISNKTNNWVIGSVTTLDDKATYYIVGKYDNGLVMGGRRRRKSRKSRKGGRKSSSRRGTRRYRR